MTKTVLVCTVGGSPNPLVTAIKSVVPEHVVFVCSGDDPATGAKGSYTIVTGTTADTIPTKTSLKADAYEVQTVPADDFSPAFHGISAILDRLTAESPDTMIMADVTGGTKTMTAALMLAAIDRPNVRLQLVTGARDNLQKVRDGTEFVVSQDVAAVRTTRNMQPYIAAWSRFAYDEAAGGFDRLLPAAPPALRGQILRLRDLSQGFAAWDRFDHAAAKDMLSRYTPSLGEWLRPWLIPLGKLSCDDEARREPLILLDLWRNAERRAARGRYDDAVGRCYRLIEWTAQWLWRQRHGIATEDFPPDRVPADLSSTIRPNNKGRISIGLNNSWKILAGTDPETPAGRFFTDQEKVLLNHLDRRNSSLLAHGFAPIAGADWQVIREWMEGRFLPMLREEMAQARCTWDVPQLPATPPA